MTTFCSSVMGALLQVEHTNFFLQKEHKNFKSFSAKHDIMMSSVLLCIKTNKFVIYRLVLNISSNAMNFCEIGIL